MEIWHVEHLIANKHFFELLEIVPLRIIDINLRPPFYSKSLLEQLLVHADIVKMNEEELDIVAKWIGDFSNEIEKIKGSICIDNNEVFTHPIFLVAMTDTVGSGDAFLLGFVHLFLK